MRCRSAGTHRQEPGMTASEGSRALYPGPSAPDSIGLSSITSTGPQNEAHAWSNQGPISTHLLAGSRRRWVPVGQ